MSDETYNIILKDGEINIPKSEFDIIHFKDWFINKVFEYDNTNTITLWEEKKIMNIIIESMRFNKLIIDTNDKSINIKYLYSLSEKLCVPENILNEIKSLDLYSNLFQIIIPKIKKCKNCYIGFKEEENHSEACIFHSSCGVTDNRKVCCGVKIEDIENPLRLGCRKGYHIAYEPDINLVEKFINIINSN